MSTVILYIASSLDGYIARVDGAIDWLASYEGGEEDYGYAKFYDSVDALLMGRKTYEQVLSFGQWPYPGKSSYVFTHSKLESEISDVIFVSGAVEPILDEISAKGVERLWLVGGTQLIAAMLKYNRVDEFIVTLIPIVLGEGIPLFASPLPSQALELVATRQYPSGLVQLHYRRKPVPY